MIDAICSEIELRKEEIKEKVETIYFGGGTPSLLTNSEIDQILSTIHQNFEVIENPEITLEANPDDLSEAYIFELTQSQINRLSIGIQSFFDDDLKAMNRAHSASESFKCLSTAIGSFENITIDLIYGIQNMSVEKWRQNLQYVFDLGIPHISSYALTVEPKTALDTFIKKGTYPPLDENLAAQHFDILVEETAKNGFVHYETSNFGKEGFFSKHNTSYWFGKSYLGIGPSAHSYNGIERSWNVSNNTKYIKALAEKNLPSENEILSIKNKFNECIMTGLRTIWGVDLKRIENEFGEIYFEHLIKSSKKFIDQDLLIITNEIKQPAFEDKVTSSKIPHNDQILKTTQKGKFLVDGITSELFMI